MKFANSRKYTKILLTILIIFLMVASCALVFHTLLYKELTAHTDYQVYSYINNQILYFHKEMNTLHHYMDYIEKNIEGFLQQGLSHREVVREMKRHLFYIHNIHAGLIFKDGEGCYTDGDVTKDIFVEENMPIFQKEGKEVFSLTWEGENGNFLALVKDCTQRKDERVMVFVAVPFAYMTEFLTPFSGGEGTILLVDPDDMSVVFGSGPSFDPSLKELYLYLERVNLAGKWDEVEADILEGQATLINERISVDSSLFFQKPLGYENLVAVALVSPEFDNQLEANLMKWFWLLTSTIVVLIGGLLVFIFLSSRHNARVLSTSRKEASEHKMHLEAIAANYIGGIVLTTADENFQLIYCNQGVYDLLGIENRKEIDNSNFQIQRYLSPESFEKLCQFVNESTENSDPLQSDLQLIQENGTPLWCRCQGRIVKIEEGVRHVVWGIYNIDERKHMEEQFSQIEFLYRISSALTSDLIFQYHFKTRTIDSPNAAMRELGCPDVVDNAPEWLLSKGYIHTDSVDEFNALLQRAQEGEELVSTILKLYINPPSTQWYDVRLSVRKNEEGNPESAVVVLRDVTNEHLNQVRYERELNYKKSIVTGSYAFFEFNLTKDLIIGDLPDYVSEGICDSYSEFIQWYIANKVYQEDSASFNVLTNTEYLRDSFYRGVCTLRFDFREKAEPPLWLSSQVTLFLDSQSGDLCMRIRLMNISDRKEKELELRKKSEYDTLLDIPNRSFFESRIEKVLDNYDESKAVAAFVVIDIDDFKTINDTYGHQMGDRTLQLLGKGLEQAFQRRAFYARLGGDEFALYLFGRSSTEAIMDELNHFVSYLNRLPLPFDLYRHLHISVGCTVVMKGDQFKELYGRADKALYKAKSRGKNIVCLG